LAAILARRQDMSPKDLMIAVLAVTASSLIIFGQASLDAVARSVPLCIFTVCGGLIMMWRGPAPVYKLAGVALVTSPFWLIPVFDRIVGLIIGVV
jgi:hypothetical protein